MFPTRRSFTNHQSSSNGTSILKGVLIILGSFPSVESSWEKERAVVDRSGGDSPNGDDAQLKARGRPKQASQSLRDRVMAL